MTKPLSIGILTAANFKNGPQKANAIMAASLAERGHYVTLFVPLLPWYYYFVKIQRKPLAWVRYAFPNLLHWLTDRTFAFSDLLGQGEARDRISVKFVLRNASRRQLSKLDNLYMDSVAQIAEYKNKFPQENQIYLIWHPEEMAHGHADMFTEIRSSFKGQTLVASPFTAGKVADHVISPPIVPAPVSPTLWQKNEGSDETTPRKDVLVFWKNKADGLAATQIVKAMQKIRPELSVTIWFTGLGARRDAQRELPDADVADSLTEAELRDLYLNHSLLLFPSKFEGFGMPPIEALACRCIPVLRPKVGAAELYAKDRENAIYWNDDSSGLSQRLVDLLSHPEQLEAMRQAAMESLVDFNPNTYGPRILRAAGIEA